MNATIDGWQFIRQLGVGEREHVRSQLLGVGIFGRADTVEQLKGCITAANALGMMLRAHVNFDRIDLHTAEQVYALFRDNQAHQLEPWSALSRLQFDSMCKKLEVMVVPGDKTPVAATVHLGILDIWTKSGGRFLGGNFANRTDDELLRMYPQFYQNTDRFWEAWNEV